MEDNPWRYTGQKSHLGTGLVSAIRCARRAGNHSAVQKRLRARKWPPRGGSVFRRRGRRRRSESRSWRVWAYGYYLAMKDSRAFPIIFWKNPMLQRDPFMPV